MDQDLVIRRRVIQPADLELIRQLIVAEGPQGRSHLSNRLCQLWDWRQANGRYRQIACRDLLRRLEAKGLIRLPPPLKAARRAGLFGPRLTSLAVYLKGRIHASYSGIRDFLQDVVNLPVSRGYVANTPANARCWFNSVWLT